MVLLSDGLKYVRRFAYSLFIAMPQPGYKYVNVFHVDLSIGNMIYFILRKSQSKLKH